MESLKNKWVRSGVQAGDTLLVHSNIKRTLVEARREGLQITPMDILESFLEALGPQGTLLLPLFNFDFTTGLGFDLRTTPSQMGALTEAGRVYPGAVRTGHPLYSFAVIGHHAPLFQHIDNESGYGKDSPFALLHALDGKIAVLDLDDQASMTFYHYVEEMLGVDYRYFKAFTGPYTLWDGTTQNKTYTLFVRDLAKGVLTHVNPAGELLWDAGHYHGSRPKQDTGLRVVGAKTMFDFVAHLIAEGKAFGTLYTTQEYEDARSRDS